MRLCFGTFAAVLKYCLWEKVYNWELVEMIVNTIDPSNDYKKKHVQVSRLLYCQANFYHGTVENANDANPDRKSPENLSKVWEKAESEDIYVVIKRWENNVIPRLSKQKRALAAFTLIDIIKQDTTIDKGEFSIDTDKIVLSHLFARILIYIVRKENNNYKDGKEDVKKITPQYIQRCANNVNTGKIEIYDTGADYPEQLNMDSEVDADPKIIMQPITSDEIDKMIIDVFGKDIFDKIK